MKLCGSTRGNIFLEGKAHGYQHSAWRELGQHCGLCVPISASPTSLRMNDLRLALGG